MSIQQPCILLVEDEGAQREVLTYNLEAEGFRVVSAETGDEALLLVAEENPDLMVLDWMLPNVSGIEICRRVKADPDTRLVVMIGEIGGDAEERAAAYIREHMTKPVVAYVAGFTAPEGRTMGHAGAIVSGSSGTAEAKKIALEAAGVRVGRTPSQTAEIARELYVSLSTVKSHVASLMAKLGARNRVEIAMWAYDTKRT